MSEASQLAQEMAFHEKKLANWAELEGLYGLIQGQDVCCFFEDCVEAVHI